MIVCLSCGHDLAESADGFSCPSCPYLAERDDGIVFFDRTVVPDYQDYDALYKYETVHPWFRHRLDIIRRAFAVHVRKDEDILEVGAGTGRTARSLEEDGFQSLSLGEMHRNGLAHARRSGLKRLYQFDLRTSPFKEHFDVIALFDVLEHIDEDALAVRNIRAMLRPGGRVVLTVPAHQWLWSRIDELSGHHRRYARTQLASLLESAGFEVLECRYFFSALVPGLLVRSLLSRNATHADIGNRSGMEMSALGNAVLRLASGPGDALLYPLRHLMGGSLLAVARLR